MIPKLDDLFVKHHTAVALKKLNFTEPCLAYYWADKPTFHYTVKYDNHNVLITRASAPLIDQVIKWFELKHAISIELFLDVTLAWNYTIRPMGPASSIDDVYTSPYVYCSLRRDADLAAIDHIIEILNDKSSKQE